MPEIKPEVTILDGAMGTMIQSAGLKLGEKPEVFALSHPESVQAIQRQYVEAGSSVLYSNTFGANRKKLHGTGHTVQEIISANMAIAKKAAGRSARVALDIGPIGELMAPLGTLSFDEAYDIFRETVAAGRDAGADLIVIETFTDLYEVRAAVLAAKENSTLPVWVTMSFESTGRTFTGTTVPAMALTLDALGVDAMGINCSLGPTEILPLIQEMRKWTNRPLVVKPNAGLPDPATGLYFITPDEFAQEMLKFKEIGVSAMGGCCGTTPAFIKALSTAVTEGTNATNLTNLTNCHEIPGGVCSASRIAPYGRVNVIGERINPTGKKRVKQAIAAHDMDTLMKLAIAQADAGADVLDINVGVPGIDEAAVMKEVVQAVQGVVDLPLMIDSSDPAAIEAGLRYANGKAIVNSVDASEKKLNAILPIAKKYGAAVVGLTIDRTMPQSVEERLAFATTIVKAAEKAGIPRKDILIDCLTLTVSAQQDQAVNTLEALRRVRKELGVHATLGVSNISFGLPGRVTLTRTFLAMALQCGLDFPIINPNSAEMMDTIYSYKALCGEDRDCAAYIERFALKEDAGETKETKKTQKAATADPAAMTLEQAILKGLGQETENITAQLLSEMDAMDVIDKKLIPALDMVGEKYERQEIFLPQLINAANAAGRGFELIKRSIRKNAGNGDSTNNTNKGKIIIATVEGDIHDIGKNIVKVVLENYGYDVIDLGKDVPVETVVRRTIEEDAHLVALSALMTTTVESMRRTIEALRKSGHPCKIMVGGAVLTPEYARQIGADFYSRDPKESADTARRVLGK